MKKPVVYVDMDMVLVDFETGALLAHGIDPQEFRTTRQQGVWDMVPSMGITRERFWTIIKQQGAAFWIDLFPTPWAKQLVVALEGLNWFILTHPQPNSACRQGKDIWIDRYFGEDFDRRIQTKYKYLLAQSNTWLIDDSEDNCREFFENGGNTILFPAVSNGLYRQAYDPVTAILPHLELIKGVQSCIKGS